MWVEVFGSRNTTKIELRLGNKRMNLCINLTLPKPLYFLLRWQTRTGREETGGGHFSFPFSRAWILAEMTSRRSFNLASLATILGGLFSFLAITDKRWVMFSWRFFNCSSW